MKKLKPFFLFIVLLTLLLSHNVKAQDSTLTHLKHLLSSLTRRKEVLPAEQVYLQTDKSYYAVNDTLWLKAYVLNADLAYSNKSGVLYLEFLNDSSRLVKRVMLPVTNGIGWGNIALTQLEFYQGNYTLRCYTNWQRNFSEEKFYTKSISIGTNENVWLVNSAVAKDKQTIKVKLQFRKLNQLALGLQDLRIKVYHGKHELYSQKLTTDIDGLLDLNFLLPDKVTGGLVIKAEAVKSLLQQSVTIPLQFTQPNDVDLQFMPEGGTLVDGLATHVAFKALDADGLSTGIEGKITDSKQREVLTFKPAHKGMGVFNFDPVFGETYTASLTLADGTHKSYPLPAVQQNGTLLNIRNPMNEDSLIIAMNTTAGAVGNYMLIGQSRETVCYAATMYIGSDGMLKKLPKSMFPTGITRFTLLNAQGRPLNERLVFIDHHDNLNINIQSDQPLYHPGDSVALHLKVNDATGVPMRGTFSMAVTDDNQSKPDKNKENILSAMLLSSGIKGTIEQPGYYLNTKDPDVWQSLDVLLLAQGWASFNWKQVADTAYKPVYPPEKEFAVQGKVTNIFGKPVSNSKIVLFSPKPLFVADTVTDVKGRFRFTNLALSDTVAYHVQARNRNNKSFNVGIVLDEFKAPPTPVYKNNMLPWYVNTDSTLTHYIRNTQNQQFIANHIAPGANVLKEVKIKAVKIIKDSHNLNGPGESDYAISEKEMQKEGKKSLLNVFEERLPGFHSGRQWYFINSQLLMVIVNGIALHKVLMPFQFADFKSWLTSESAEDVKGIELIRSNTADYTFTFISPLAVPSNFAFVEITTYGGKGPFNSNPTPGTYLYKPMPFVSTKEFYRPKYTVKNKDLLAQDTRSTIHWEPNVITDKAGNATVSFYAAGKPGTYTYIIEGCDLNGLIGYTTGKITVK